MRSFGQEKKEASMLASRRLVLRPFFLMAIVLAGGMALGNPDPATAGSFRAMMNDAVARMHTAMNATASPNGWIDDCPGGVCTAAQTQTLLSQLGAYSLALAAGLGSTLLVIELHRVQNFVRKIRLRRLRLE